MANLKTDIPQRYDERRNAVIAGIVRRARQQQHDIDVGVRVELRAPVATDSDKRDMIGQFTGMLVPQALEDVVDNVGALADKRCDGFAVEESTLQVLAARCKYGATAKAIWRLLQASGPRSRCR